MGSVWMRLVWTSAIAVIAGMTASCADNNVKECFADGELYYCPADKQCGGLQRLCVDPGGCGNGLTEGSEECDDGNVLPGDGCSPECRIEACGNGRPDPGETCDDGNKIDDDGCTNDCTSTNTCGNGITDKAVGEECDDGGTVAGDGCGPTCRFERCGNHINDPGEECDDGNLVSGDGCSDTCFFEGCGNGRLDPGEYCDDGNLIDNDNCNKDCTSDNRCGNHIVDHNVGEVCDEGGVETADCTADCHSQRECGDGIVDPGAGEECDNGVALNKDNLDCRSDCILNRCGDGFANTDGTRNHEDCDDGPHPTGNDRRVAVPTESPTCNADCTNAVCNDHKVNRSAGEECDDGTGNNANDRDCTLGCKVNRCGDGLPNTSGPAHVEACDDGNRIDGDGCTNQCTLPGCGDGVLEGTEQCDDGNQANDDGCSAICRFELCGDGIKNGPEECDRADPALPVGACNLDCTLSHCGDRKINRDAGEECDDGTSNGDDKDCTADCKVNVCGDGLPNLIGPTHREECDDHNRVDGDACTNQCKLPRCGDGILEGLEQCDDGNRSNDDGCSAICRFEFCGDGIKNGSEQCDRADPAVDPATCNLDCTTSRCGDGKLNREAGEECDVPGGNADDLDCTAGCKVNVCGDGLVDLHGSHPEACDDHNHVDGDACTNQCTLPSCGDGVIEGVEQCDDGNHADDDGCSAGCRFEFCGDGVVNNGEPCDFALTPASCNLDCTPSICGDGKLNASAVPPEQCDDGGTTSEDGCSASCRLEHCGNGVIDAFEECDGAAGDQPCSASCRVEKCGNGIVDNDDVSGVHEACDLGANNSDTGACLESCQLASCGDGRIQAGVEECDAGDGNSDHGDCTSRCRLHVCGDGLIDSDGADPEQCDDGIANTEDALCPYGQTCAARCDTQCHTLVTVTPACGDGIINGPELCDDHNTDACGSCSAGCSQVTSRRAIGFVIPVGGNALSTGDSFTLDDGVHQLTFTFVQVVVLHVNPPTVGVIELTGSEDLATMSAAIADAITLAHGPGLNIAVDVVDPVSIRLIHDRPTALGNRPATEHVAAPTFFVVGMVAGAGGDCDGGVGCRTGDDCASGACTAGVCDGVPAIAPLQSRSGAR